MPLLKLFFSLDTIAFMLLYLFSTSSMAIDNKITADPHRAPSGFFDIHICNWHDRPPFYLALFGTEQYEHVTSIEIMAPDDTKIGELDLRKFTVTKKKGKKERHVFLTQLKIPGEKIDGWYKAKINFNDRPSQSAHDFVIHQVIGRARNHSPSNGAEDIKAPEVLKWDAVKGATLYKVFIKDMWGGEKLIHTSDLLGTNEFKVPKGLLKPGGYYAWRVHARDLNEHIQLGDFNIGSLSQWVEFSIAE